MASDTRLLLNNYQKIPFKALAITIYLALLGGLIIGFTIFGLAMFLRMPQLDALTFSLFFSIVMGLPIAYVVRYFWSTKYPDILSPLRSIFLVVAGIVAILTVVKMFSGY